MMLGEGGIAALVMAVRAAMSGPVLNVHDVMSSTTLCLQVGNPLYNEHRDNNTTAEYRVEVGSRNLLGVECEPAACTASRASLSGVTLSQSQLHH